MKTVTLAIVTAIVVGVAFALGTLATTGAWTMMNDSNKISTQALAAEKGGMYGIVYYTLRDSDGNIKYETSVRNLITNAGEDMIQTAFSVGIAAADTIDTICVGTTGIATPAAETGAGAALVGTPTGGSIPDYCKADASVTLVENGGVSQQVEVDATFVGGTDFVADAAIAEAVLADTEPGANGIPGAADTFARQTFTAITVANGDSLTVKWTITIAE